MRISKSVLLRAARAKFPNKAQIVIFVLSKTNMFLFGQTYKTLRCPLLIHEVKFKCRMYIPIIFKVMLDRVQSIALAY